VGVGGRVKKRQQLLLAYTGVLRGLIDRGDAVQARRVAELLRTHLGYVEGSSDGGGVDGEGGGGGSGNVRTDAALQCLRSLEVEGPSVLSRSLTDSKVDADYFYPFLKKRDPEVIKTLNAAPRSSYGFRAHRRRRRRHQRPSRKLGRNCATFSAEI